MVRPPWTIRVPESATAAALHTFGRGFILFAPEVMEEMLNAEAEAEEDVDRDFDEEATIEADAEPLDPDNRTETADEDRVEDETETIDDQDLAVWPEELSDVDQPTELMDQDILDDGSDASDSSGRARRPDPYDEFSDEEQRDEAFLTGSSPKPPYSDSEADGLDQELGDKENDDLGGEDEEQSVYVTTPDKASFDSFWHRRPNTETPAEEPNSEDTSVSLVMQAYGTAHATPEAYAAALTALYARAGDDEETKRTKALNNLRFAIMRFERKEFRKDTEEHARVLESIPVDREVRGHESTSTLSPSKSSLCGPRGVKRKDLAEDSDDDSEVLDVDEALDTDMEDESDTAAREYESDAFSIASKEFITKHCKIPPLDEDGPVEDFTEAEVDTVHEGVLEWLADQSQILDQDQTEDEDHRFLRIVNQYIECMNEQDATEDFDYYVEGHYAPLDIDDFSKGVAAGLSETFPYPLTIVEFSPTYLGRHENRVASVFVEMLRLAMSLPQNKMTKRLSFRNLLANEVIACIESVSHQKQLSGSS